MKAPQRIIINGMNWADIVEVAKADAKPVTGELFQYWPKYTHLVKTSRNRGQIDFKPFEIVRPSGISWVVRFRSCNYADFKRRGLVYLLYGLFHYRGGLFVINTFVPNEYRPGVAYDYMIYTPHFFERYRERYLKDDTTPIKDVINYFFKYNSVGGLNKFYSENNATRPVGEFGTMEHGAALGQWEHGVFIAKTFISSELFFIQQQEHYKTAIAEIQDYNNRTIYNYNNG